MGLTSHASNTMCIIDGAFLVAQLVNHLPAKQEACVQSLGWEDPLEKGLVTHSSILAWRSLGSCFLPSMVIIALKFF